MKKKVTAVLLFLLGLSCLWGCNQEEQESKYHLYYLSQEESRVVAEDYTPQASRETDLIQEFLDKLKEEPPEELQPLLPQGVEINESALADKVLNLDMNSAYLEMDSTREILTRAGLVRTFTQISDISAVTITVNGTALKNADGTAVGRMTQESFVENSGKQINDYKYISMNLYFADSTGEKLVGESRSLYYSSNVPLERVVVEQLIKGPKESGHLATLPAETKILGVSLADNICYVNLDSSFEGEVAGVQPETTIYSIVNTLVSVCGVEEVQISVNGDTKVNFRDEIELDQFFKSDPGMLQEGQNG